MAMEKRRDSLPVRFLTELSNIFNFPSGRRRSASNLRTGSSGNSKGQQPTTATTSTQPSTRSNPSSSQGSKSRKPSTSSGNLQLSRSISTTVIHDVRPQTPHTRRVADSRVKSSSQSQGQRPLENRSTSLHYLNHINPNPQNRPRQGQPPQPSPLRTVSVSVDDLLELNLTSFEFNDDLTAAGLLQPTLVSSAVTSSTNGLPMPMPQLSTFDDIDPYSPSTHDARRSSSGVSEDDHTLRQVRTSRLPLSTMTPATSTQARSTSNLSNHPWYSSTTSLNTILTNSQERPRATGVSMATRNSSTAAVSVGGSESPIARNGDGTTTSRPFSAKPNTIITCENGLGGLKLRERVVWFNDKDVAQVGVVKWLGKISNREMAGVEFDNHVGNSSGKFNGRQLFTTVVTRGRFVPIAQLVLYIDYVQRFPSNAPAKIKFPSISKDESPAIICVICQDSLFNQPENEGNLTTTTSNAENYIISTTCGHLCHNSCLKQWFNIKGKPTQPCPYCQRPVTIAEVIRIFPIQGA